MCCRWAELRPCRIPASEWVRLARVTQPLGVLVGCIKTTPSCVETTLVTSRRRRAARVLQGLIVADRLREGKSKPLLRLRPCLAT